jgi:tRNA(Ile)-lysidine synthase
MNKENGAKKIHLPGYLMAVCDKGTLFVCNINYDPFIFKDIPADNFISKKIKIPGDTELGFRGLSFNIKWVDKKDVKLDSSSSNKVYIDYDKTGPYIKVRFFRPGDRFSPLGMKGTKKLKSFFIDEKVPRNQRKLIPLLTTKNDDIIWVYEKRIGECYKITDKSKNILLVEGITR